MSENSIISQNLYFINMCTSQIQMPLKWKPIQSLSDMNIMRETSFSSFLLNRQVTVRSYLKKTGAHFDSIQCFRKYLWHSYCTIQSVLHVGIQSLTKKDILLADMTLTTLWESRQISNTSSQRGYRFTETVKCSLKEKSWPLCERTGIPNINSRARESILEEESHTEI